MINYNVTHLFFILNFKFIFAYQYFGPSEVKTIDDSYGKGKFFDAQDAVFPQFATHNAYTLGAIYQMGKGKDFDFAV